MPVGDADLHWAIIAKVDTAGPSSRGGVHQTIVLVTAGMIFRVCLLAILLAQMFVRRSRRLEQVRNGSGAGDCDVAIPVKTGDGSGSHGGLQQDGPQPSPSNRT